VIAPSPQAHCVCVADCNPHALCWGTNGFHENEIRAHLIPLRGEAVEAIAFDGCIATADSELRCDGVMVLRRRGQTDLLLVELKNTRNAEHGFQQLIYTAHQRSDYQAIQSHEERRAPGPLKQQAFLITTKRIAPLERAKAERKANGLKITVIPVQRGSGEVPNLRDHIS